MMKGVNIKSFLILKTPKNISELLNIFIFLVDYGFYGIFFFAFLEAMD